MTTILVTGAVSAVAFRVRSFLTEKNIVMGDYMPLPPVQQLLALPSPSSSTYLHEFLTFCLERQISTVIPIRRSELLQLVNAKALFDDYGITLHVPENISDDVPVYSSEKSKQLSLYADGLKWQDDQGFEFLLICEDVDLS